MPSVACAMPRRALLHRRGGKGRGLSTPLHSRHFAESTEFRGVSRRSTRQPTARCVQQRRQVSSKGEG
jgi:hypothetical protein